MRNTICFVLLLLFLTRAAQAQQPDLRLPLPDGNQTQCTQGNGGGDSHNIPQTQNAIDLDDQPNTPGRIVIAAASGTAYFRSNQAGGWGNNVRIDHGNGYYTLYAHLASISIINGKHVNVGDQIGVIGGTSGDPNNPWPVHLHFALHQGNANADKIANTVLANRIWARDVTGGGDFRWFRSDEFKGDLSVPPGRVYEAGTPPSTPPSQTDIYVDGNYNGTEVGTPSQPFKTITAAVNASDKTKAVVIHAVGMWYHESVKIRQNLRIVRNGGSGPVRIRP